MPKMPYDEIEEIKDYSPVDDGTYPVKVERVEETRTQYDDEMWRVEFTILDGKFAGRKLFDNMVFSQNGRKRVKFIVSRLGLPTTGEADLTPDMIIGKKCWVTTQIEEYTSDDNKVKKRNSIPFAGYERWEEGEKKIATPSAKEEREEEEAF